MFYNPATHMQYVTSEEINHEVDEIIAENSPDATLSPKSGNKLTKLIKHKLNLKLKHKDNNQIAEREL